MSATSDVPVKPLGGAHVSPFEATIAAKAPRFTVEQKDPTVPGPPPGPLEAAAAGSNVEHSMPAPRTAMDVKTAEMSLQVMVPGGAAGGEGGAQPTPYAPFAAQVAPQKSATSDAPVKPLGGAHTIPDGATASAKPCAVVPQ